MLWTILTAVVVIGLLYLLTRRHRVHNPQKCPISVGIIGGGFSGVCMAIKLKLRGIPFTIYEKADSLGGTWYKNTYPGCACDVKSYLYSYSFSPNLSWSRRYSPQQEILAYLKDVANKYGIAEHAKLNHKVEKMEWCDKTKQWNLHFEHGAVATENVVVCSVGQLDVPKMPSIPGIDEFSGKSWHTARWNHSFDLKDKTVAVVGNGASAIQVIPEIAKEVEQLYIFQSTPSFTVPRPNPKYNINALFNIPFIMPIYRWLLYLETEARWPAFVYDSINKIFESQVVKEMKPDIPKELEKHTLPDYKIGCRRVLLTSDYLPTLQRSNVELIPERAVEVTEKGIISKSGKELDVDAIVFATGFNSHKFLETVDVKGKDSKSLHDMWNEDIAYAYLGMSVPDFPNFYITYGPHTNLGHSSILTMVEIQANYISKLVDMMIVNDYKTADIKSSVMENYKKMIDTRMERTVFASDCNSWYRAENTGKVRNNAPYSVSEYYWRAMYPKKEDYDFA